MSSDRHHSTSPRSSATHQRRNSLDGATAERAPCLSIQNEAEEEAGGRNALVGSTANTNHHPFGIGGTIRLSTVTNTSNGGVNASSFLSSALGQFDRDQTCTSTPFTLPFQLYVKIAQFVPPDLGQLARLVAVLPPDQWEYFFRCYLKDNWSFLVHALDAMTLGTFRRRFQLWFSRNLNYLEVLVTDTRVPIRVREVLTGPVQAIVRGSVDLLSHILDNTDADINGIYELHEEIPQSLLEIAINEGEFACADYLLSRNDLDVHAIISDPFRDHEGHQVVFTILSLASGPALIPNFANYLPRVLRHPSCDINRSHVIATGPFRKSLLTSAIQRALMETDPDSFPLHRDVILLILRQGGNPYMSAAINSPSAFGFVRWQIHNGSPVKARIGLMVLDLLSDFITDSEINGSVSAAGAA